MNLTFLIYSYFPYGGQQRDFYRIAKECVRRGHKVRVYTMKWEGLKPDDIEVVLVPVTAMSRHGLYQKYTRWVQTAIDKHPGDLVIGFNKMPGLDVHFAADPCFIEKAETQRGAYYKYMPRFRHFKKYEESVFGRNANTQVLVLSPLQKQGYLEHYPDCDDRLHFVPPGISRDRQIRQNRSQLRQQFREEFKIDENQFLLLQIGSGFRVKGVDRSLTAIASLPEAIRTQTRYMLVGQDKPDRFLRMAAKLGIEKQITILPGQDDIPRFLAAADLLLHPAYSESAGYVLLEATIAGLPVLTTASCGYSFHISEAESGKVCQQPFSQKELNSYLLEMLQSLKEMPWSEKGLAYGENEELYAMPEKATDLIEKFSSLPHTAKGYSE